MVTDKKLRLNMRDLDYLRQLAIDKNFTTAAKQCLVSQPTLSTQIRKIEDHLGVTIFERDNKNVVITPIGEKIIAQANRVLANANQLHTIASTAENPFSGNYNIGIIPTISPYLLPKILSHLQSELEDLNIIIQEDKRDILIQQLHDGNLDAVIAADIRQYPSSIKIHTLYQEPLYLVCNPNKHNLNDKINLDNLKHEKIIMLEHGDCLRDKVMQLTDAKAHQTSQQSKTDRLETICSLISADQGVSIVPKLALESINHNLKVIDIDQANHAQRSIQLLYRSRSIRKICSDKIASLIKSAMKP